jgi:hypothetical protein
LIDANTLLNPEYQNAELRAYAFLSAQYKHGVRSTIDCLKPFVIYAIADQAGNQLNWPTIRTYLREKYGLSVPFYMLERMEWALRDAKAIIKTENSHILICGDARPSISENDADFTINDIDRLGGALQRFAANRGMEKPLTAENWNDIIVPFFMNRSPPGDKETAKVRGVLISDPKTYDFTIVADFIMDGYASMSPSYKMVERVYYGVLVAEFLTQIESAGNKASFKGLGVVYDAPVILRLLGCSGKIFKDATLELHDTLRDLGCKTYFFAHTYDEISIAIEAILKCYENGQPMFRETQEAISRREISINDIYSIKADLDLRLAGLGLLEHSAGYSSRNSDDFQIDEAGFKDRLQKYRSWGSAGSLAAERDVMSLALIMRLRNGKQVRDVSKSGFVFITHNTRLANMSKDFLRTEGQLNDGAAFTTPDRSGLSTQFRLPLHSAADLCPRGLRRLAEQCGGAGAAGRLAGLGRGAAGAGRAGRVRARPTWRGTGPRDRGRDGRGGRSRSSPLDLAALRGRAVLVEDADRRSAEGGHLNDETLFHLINMAGVDGGTCC